MLMQLLSHSWQNGFGGDSHTSCTQCTIPSSISLLLWMSLCSEWPITQILACIIPRIYWRVNAVVTSLPPGDLVSYCVKLQLASNMLPLALVNQTFIFRFTVGAYWHCLKGHSARHSLCITLQDHSSIATGTKDQNAWFTIGFKVNIEVIHIL